MKKYALFILSMFMTATISFSQLSPVALNPMEHNGSFAGMADEGRLTVNATLPFDRFSGYGYYASYDKFFKSLNTGIGLTAYNAKYMDKYELRHFSDSTQAVNKYESEDKFRYIELAIAPKISIRGKYTISPSIKVKYGVISELRLRGTDEIYDLESKNVNVTAGLAFNTSKYYIGYAVRIFEEEKFTFKGADSYQYLPSTTAFYSVLEAGYSFSRRNENSKFSFTPQLAMYASESNGNLRIPGLDLSLRFQYGRFLYGHTIKSNFTTLNTRLGVFIGWQQGSFRTLLMLEDEGGLVLNFRYLIPNKDKKRSPIFW